jgi:hypothetical protein
VTPLILHHDNLEWATKLDRWQKDPANKAVSVAGDDRTPAWRWIGCLYFDRPSEDRCIAIPSDNLMTVLREGGAKCPTGKRGATFKRQTQSGCVVNEIAWPIIVNGAPIQWKTLSDLMSVEDFAVHEAACRDCGFELFVKRAKIQQSKHVRVRPRFDAWEASVTITVMDETITTDVLQNIMEYAGTYSGLGDWRPSSPKSPGPYGRFTSTVKALK